MREAKEVMDAFMERLASDEYIKENQPNNGPEMDLNFVENQISSYSTLLKSGIIDAVLNDDQG